MGEKKRFATVKKIIRYVSLAIVILFVLPVVYLKYFVRDIPRIDDSDMKMERTETPDNENAYPFLLLTQISYNDTLLSGLLNKLTWYHGFIEKQGRLSDEKLEEAMKLFEDRFPIMDKAAAMPYSQGPEIFRPEDRIPNYLSMRSLAALRLERAKSYAEKGNVSEAVDEALQVFRFGARVSQNDGGTTLISLMVGIAVKNMSLQFLNSVISEHGMPQGVEKEIISTLTEGYESRDAWIDVWKFEYRGLNHVLDEIEKGSAAGKSYMDDSGLVAPQFIQRFFYNTIFKKERVRRSFHKFHARMIEDANASDYSQIKPFVFRDYTVAEVNSLWDYPLLALKGELGSYLYTSMAIPNFTMAVQKRFYNDLLIDAMRLKIAILAYERDHGKPPATLSGLVPDYIGEIPVDSFDGKPIRYDADRGIFCSPGSNGKDDGCDSKVDAFEAASWKEIREQKDLVFGLK